MSGEAVAAHKLLHVSIALHFELYFVTIIIIINNYLNPAWIPGLWPGNEAKY